MPPLNSLVRQSFHSAGGMRVFRFANRKGVRVLMYHRFSEDTRDLEWQCKHICRNYHPISLDNYGDAIANGHSVPFNSLIVTVDDGYRDFLYVHPLFQRYGIPSTVYLVSDFIDGKLWLWWNQLEYAFLNSTHTLLKLGLEGKETTFSFQTAEQRVVTCRNIAAAMTRVEDSERLRLMQLIPELLEIEIPSKPPTQWAPLEWEEVRKLIHEGVSFGAHTKTHTILSRLREPSKQEEEITQAKLRIEEQVGQNVRHFCYPNGAFSDFDEHSVSLVKSLGFETATTTERGLNFPGSEPLLLRRLGVELDLPRTYFAELLAGARKQ